MRQISIRPKEAGQRFDKYLGKYLKKAPKSFLYKMLRKKNITLNGKKATGQEKLCAGDTVKLFLSDETIEKFSENLLPADLKTSENCRLDILYEDTHTIFINKPAGMLSQKAAPTDVSLVEHLISYLLESGQITREELATFRPSVCNRLDRNTSGIVAAGKTLPALQDLSLMFRDRTLGKYYLCLVKGNVAGSQRIDGYLSKDTSSNKVTLTKTERPEAVRIETEYRTLAAGDDCTLLEVHLITGKTHQIRAHLASIGHPILGDYKYGDRKKNDPLRSRYGLKHQLLHSARLIFPECEGALAALSGKVIEAPLPDLFAEICRGAGITLKDIGITSGNTEIPRAAAGICSGRIPDGPPAKRRKEQR